MTHDIFFEFLDCDWRIPLKKRDAACHVSTIGTRSLWLRDEF